MILRETENFYFWPIAYGSGIRIEKGPENGPFLNARLDHFYPYIFVRPNKTHYIFI